MQEHQSSSSPSRDRQHPPGQHPEARTFSEWCLAAFQRATGNTPYPYQEDIFRAPDTPGAWTIFNKSRQMGISEAIATRAMAAAALQEKEVLIVSPSQRQVGQFMRYALQAYEALSELVQFDIRDETRTMLTFKHGGSIRSLPNSPSTVRGFPADLLILDEYAHFLHGTDREIWRAVQPSLSRGGQCYIISTPFGEQGEYFKFWNDERSPFRKVLLNWRQCHHLAGNIEQIRGTLDEQSFAQEYENTFIGEADSEFPLRLIHSCIERDLEWKPQPLGVHTLGGADIGRHRHQTAILAADRDDQKFIFRFRKVFMNTEYQHQEAWIDSLLSQVAFSHFNIDATGIGSMLAENLKRKHKAVREVVFNNELKERMVLNAKRLMEQGRVKIPDDAVLVNAIHAIQRKKTAGNHLSFDAEEDEKIGHADQAWALFLALLDADRPKRPFRVF